MPTYDYRCQSCGFKFEEFQSMSADFLVVCPKCAEPSLKRLMSGGGGLLFKGSGFYLTDYKKATSSDGSDKVSPKSESKSESKPESRPSTETSSSSGEKK